MEYNPAVTAAWLREYQGRIRRGESAAEAGPAALRAVTASASARSRPVTTMADGARLRSVALRDPGVGVGQDRARQQWAARQADMDATARRWQAVREHRAGIDLAYRMRLI